MSEKYVIIKNDDKFVDKKEVSDEVYKELFNATHILEEFDYVAFLANSYEKAKEDFFNYDFSQFNVREIDMFTVMLNSLNSIATNNNLWEAYLKRTYTDDSAIFLACPTSKKEKKSLFGMKDSEYYDQNIEYVIAKALRNMVVHSEKPYSEIWYDDDFKRHFIIHTEVLLHGNTLNISGKQIVTNCGMDYFDVVDIIKRAFEITTELNLYIINYLIKKEWINYYSSRLTIRKYLGIEWQGAYLVEINPKYPPDHVLYLSTTSISKNAMNSILSIAAKSL